jgi:plasmid maintenance system killer protein
MKKIILFFSFICVIETAICQNQARQYDSSFKAFYKTLALHPGYKNPRGIVRDSVIRRWDKDINIFVDGGIGKERKEIIAKLKNTIALIYPALNNKIKISFADDKSSANYLINLNIVGENRWYLKWDRMDNIYSCIVNINTRITFNYDQQAALASHYFLKTLGDFTYPQDAPLVVSNMRLWRQDINNIDLQILRVHYSDDIKPGMAEKDIDNFFSTHSN